MSEDTERPELPAWLNPDLITEEMWSIRPRALELTRELRGVLQRLVPQMIEVIR